MYLGEDMHSIGYTVLVSSEACADSTMCTVCCAGSVVSAEGKGGAFECMYIYMYMYMYVCT